MNLVLCWFLPPQVSKSGPPFFSRTAKIRDVDGAWSGKSRDNETVSKQPASNRNGANVPDSSGGSGGGLTFLASLIPILRVYLSIDQHLADMVFIFEE